MKYKVNNSTLCRRLNRTQVSRLAANRERQLFTPGEEAALQDYCLMIDNAGFPLSYNQIH